MGFRVRFAVLLIFLPAHVLSLPSSSRDGAPCGVTKLTDPSGIITSPNYPLPNQHQINCEWIIISPPNSLLRLEIVDLDLDLDDNCNHGFCCSRHFLSLPNEGGRGYEMFCGHKRQRDPIIVAQQNTSIHYYSSEHRKVGRGFTLRYTIDQSKCEQSEFQCRTGSCIPIKKRCNRAVDCLDGTDEENCYEYHDNLCTAGRAQCILTPKLCFSIPMQSCDGVLNCPHGEDEINCVSACPDKIACASGRGCYTPTQRCNGIRNCADSSDEDNCEVIACNPMQFVCLNGACVAGDVICDGTDDCGDNSDEERCTRTTVMTAASLGLLACVFLSCIGLSCLYRFYTSKLRASTEFLRQLEGDQIDENVLGCRDPPPSYSDAVADTRVLPCEMLPSSARIHRSRGRRHRRRRSLQNDRGTSTQGDVPNILLSASKRPMLSHVELANVALEPRWGTPRSTPSISPSRDSVTSATSCDDFLHHVFTPLAT